MGSSRRARLAKRFRNEKGYEAGIRRRQQKDELVEQIHESSPARTHWPNKLSSERNVREEFGHLSSLYATNHKSKPRMTRAIEREEFAYF